MKSFCTLTLVMAAGLATAQDQLVGFEYWFDENDTEREFVEVAIPDAVLAQAHDAMFSLVPGQHTIHYRLKDANARWSSVVFRPFTVHADGPHQITTLRYWTDQVNPFPADMVTEAVQSPAQVLDILTNIDLCTHPDTGATKMFYQVQDNYGRWSSALAWNFTVDVVGEAAGAATITCADCDNDIEPNTDYTFVASADGASQYDWTFPAGWTIVSGQGEAIVIANSPANPMTGAVIVSPSNECGEGTQGSIFLGTDVMDIIDGVAFSLYPNPAAQQVFIDIVGSSAMEVTLFSSTGQQLGGVQRFAAGGPVQLEVGDLANGTYIVQVNSELGSSRARFTVVH